MKRKWLPPLLIIASFDEINEPRETFDWNEALAQRWTPEEREAWREERRARREERRKRREEWLCGGQCPS